MFANVSQKIESLNVDLETLTVEVGQARGAGDSELREVLQSMVQTVEREIKYWERQALIAQKVNTGDVDLTVNEDDVMADDGTFTLPYMPMMVASLSPIA